jgi:hypothetical protein
MSDRSTVLPDPSAALRAVRIVAPLAAAVMVAAVVAGLIAAPTGAASELVANVWGRVTTIDLYLALAAAGMWIGWRERSLWRTVVWAMLLLTTGSVALWAYIAIAARRAATMSDLLLGPEPAETHGTERTSA